MPPECEDPAAPAVVLVDYDNIKPIAQETGSDDVAENLVQLRELIASALKQVPSKVEEVVLRVYGGWTDERGTMTRRGNWMLATIGRVRGLANGIRFIPTMAVSPAVRQLRLKGLYRVN